VKFRPCESNGYDIALVQRLLQHSSASTTQRYIGIEPQRIEKAIEGHADLI
jgi:site-specific recombinase XerD